MKSRSAIRRPVTLVIDDRSIRYWKMCARCGTWRGRNSKYDSCFTCFVNDLEARGE